MEDQIPTICRSFLVLAVLKITVLSGLLTLRKWLQSRMPRPVDSFIDSTRGVRGLTVGTVAGAQGKRQNWLIFTVHWKVQPELPQSVVRGNDSFSFEMACRENKQ